LAVEAAELAVEAAEATGSRIGQVDALQVLAEALLEQDQPELALHTLELVGAVDRRAQGRVALLRARARLAQGQLGVALKLLTEAGARFEAVTDKAGLAEVAHGQGTVLRLLGQPLEAAERFHRVLALNKGKDPRLEVTGLAGRIACHLIGGQPAMVEADLRRLWALAHLSGDTRSLARASYVTGLNGLVGGRWSAAERGFRTALGLGATLGDDRLQFAAENALGEVLRYQSILDAAARAYGRAARLARSRRWGLLEAVARINLCLLWWTPERGPALAELEAVSALLEAAPQHWVWVLVHLLRGVLAAEADDRAEAEAQLGAALQAGLGGYQSPDLLPPLHALIDQATAKGWQSVATRAKAARALLHPAPTR
jgi:tetratricopeptide (TPR) repeat protein